MALEVAGGQWKAVYNDEELEGIEEIEPDVNTEEAEVEDISGFTYRKTRSRSVQFKATVYSTGIPNLKKMIPDFWQAAGSAIAGQPTGTLATTGGAGVITFGSPECGDTARLAAPLQMVPCENPAAHTLTLFDAEAEITDISFDDSILKYEITFSSRSVATQLAKGAITFPV